MLPERREKLQTHRQFQLYEVSELLTNPHNHVWSSELRDVRSAAFRTSSSSLAEEEFPFDWLEGASHILIARENGKIVGAVEYSRSFVGIEPQGEVLEDFEKKLLFNWKFRSEHTMKVGDSVLFINDFYIDPNKQGEGIGSQLVHQLFALHNPAITVSYTSNATYVHTLNKTVEEMQQHAYVGGIPLGEYPVPFAVYFLHTLLRNKQYSSISDLVYRLVREPSSIWSYVSLDLISKLNEQHLLNQFSEYFPAVLAGFDRSENEETSIRHHITPPIWGTALDRRLGPLFESLEGWNKNHQQVLTLPVVTIDPARFPMEMSLGRFDKYDVLQDPDASHARSITTIPMEKNYGPEPTPKTSQDGQQETTQPVHFEVFTTKQLVEDATFQDLLEKIWQMNERAFGAPPNKNIDFKSWLAGSTHVQIAYKDAEPVGVIEFTQRQVGVDPRGPILNDIEHNVLNKLWNRFIHSMTKGTNVLYINSLYVDPAQSSQGIAVEMQRKLLGELQPAYVISFSKNAGFVSSHQKAAEEQGLYTYMGGVPLGDYPLYYAVYELCKQITAEWYKDFNELMLFTDNKTVPGKLPKNAVQKLFQEDMWGYMQGGIGIKIIGFGKGGRVSDEPLRGPVIHPREGSALAERTQQIFESIQLWNSMGTYRSFTGLIVSIDPKRFPLGISLGKFENLVHVIPPYLQNIPQLN